MKKVLISLLPAVFHYKNVVVRKKTVKPHLSLLIKHKFCIICAPELLEYKRRIYTKKLWSMFVCQVRPKLYLIHIKV